MAKYYGVIGYAKSVETEPGYWENKIIEKKYYGDITRNISRYQSQNNNINDNIVSNNMISIIADPYASENFQHMIYATYLGTKWKISNIEVEFPRLLISLGGVYNGPNTK